MKIKNAKLLLQRFRTDLKEFSFTVAMARLLKDLPFGKWEKRRNRYEKAVLGYLDSKYGEKIKQLLQERKSDERTEQTSITVWVMWLQGADHMPPIVKACYKQLKQVVPSKIRVELLTEDNIDQFIEIKDYVKEKYKAGIISPTHLSDIIRVKLLAKYGGCWVDATVWLEQWPEKITGYSFFTLHAPGLFPEFIFRGNWTTFFLFVRNETRSYFYILEQLYEQYWEEHNQVIDYLVFDYFIKLLSNVDMNFKSLINQLPVNREFYCLITRLNDEFKKEEYIKIRNLSAIQKLTYKGKLRIFGDNGKLTYYGYLVKAGRDYDE